MNVRASTAARAWRALAGSSNAIVGGLIVAAGGLLLVSMWLGWLDILPHKSHTAAEDPPAGELRPTTVELTADKLAAVGLKLTRAALQPVQTTRDVPGQITYDEARRVPLNAPVDGVVLKVLADPAQAVNKGQPLAILSCAEIGLARDTVEKRKADLELARREAERASIVAQNVAELLALLSQKPKLAEVESALADRPLGDYREKILGAYSKLLLSEQVLGASDALPGGALSNRLLEERRSNREQAAALFTGACETARFAAVQERDRAKAAAEQAERLLSVAQKSLANLLGPWADMEPVTGADRLNELLLLAPATGHVVERQAVQSARVAAGSPLFVVADTSQVWVSAEIHERDWRALEHIRPGDALRLRVPAIESELVSAKVRWVGAQVEAVRRSVPLIAELANEGGQLKPGMFVWALLPLDRPHDALVVPAGAIMRHENQPFVFVPDGERKFRRVDVQLGIETQSTVEITAGLTAGDEVVAHGAFYLKSELLLEREE